MIFDNSDKITVDVLISNPYNDDKYTGVREPCYLEEALMKKFPLSNICVGGCGISIIDGVWYVTSDDTPFNSIIAEENAGKTITIILEKQY